MDEDFVVEISPEAVVQSKILPTDTYLFRVKGIERAIDMNSEEEVTLITTECLHPEYQGWEKALRFRDGEEPTKNNVRFLEACGVSFEAGKRKRVPLSRLKGMKFYALVQKSSDERFGVFNRFNEFRPFDGAAEVAADEEDDE